MKRLKIAAVLFTFVIAGAVIGAFAYLRSSMETVKPLVMNMGEKIQTFNSKPSQIFSTDGKLLYEVMPIYRESISLSDVPDIVQKAFLAAEDKRFLTHSGVDPMGLGRSVFKFVRAGEAQGGGSTITMQLAKMLFSASEKSMQRKIQDISIALEMEKEYTKDFIRNRCRCRSLFWQKAKRVDAR